MKCDAFCKTEKTGRIHRPISDNTYIPRALLLKLVSKNNRGKQGLFLAIRSLRAQEIGLREEVHPDMQHIRPNVDRKSVV